MKKVGLGYALLCVSVAMLGGTASAGRTKSISLIAEQVGQGHRIKHGFVFHEKLYNHGKHVGRDKVRITGTGPRYGPTLSPASSRLNRLASARQGAPQWRASERRNSNEAPQMTQLRMIGRPDSRQGRDRPPATTSGPATSCSATSELPEGS